MGFLGETPSSSLTVLIKIFISSVQQQLGKQFSTKGYMTKRDLVTRISDETGWGQQDVLKVVQSTLDYISGAVAGGETVELRNFGVFEVKVRRARVGRNPNQPEQDVKIPPRSVVKFKPGKEMREAVLRISTNGKRRNGNGKKRAAPKRRR